MSEFSASGMMQHAHAQDIVMVCVTRQKTCARLIERGESIATGRGLPLHVVHAVKTGENFLGNIYEGEALEYLFTATQLSGGTLSVVRADDVGQALYEYAMAHHAAVMVVGRSPEQPGVRATFLSRIQSKLPDLIVEVE